MGFLFVFFIVKLLKYIIICVCIKVTAFPWICQFHTYLYNKVKSTQIPCCLILRASNCARVLVCPECSLPWRLSWSLILAFFFTPSSHTSDKGRLGLTFSSDSSSFLFLKNKEKSSQEEMGSAVCKWSFEHSSYSPYSGQEGWSQSWTVCRIVKCAADWYWLPVLSQNLMGLNGFI